MKIFSRWHVALCFFALVNLPGQLGAQSFKPVEPRQELPLDALAVAVNSATHTLYHEIGHMLVSTLEIPIFGREEDAVDNLATIMLVEQDTEAADQILVDTIYSFFAIARADTQEPAYYGEHSLDEQRGYQMVCLMVGVDPDFYGEIADMVELPDERRETCETDSVVTFDSWLTIMEDNTPGDAAKSGTVSILYDDANAGFELVRNGLVNAGILEQAKEDLRTDFAVPIDLSLIARHCNEPNAWWDPELREIVLCYELIDYIAAVSLVDLTQD